MEIIEAIKLRHSVRRYSDKQIESDKINMIQLEVDKINSESGLNFKFVYDEPEAFGGLMAHYGKFSGVKNYVAFIGKKSEKLEEKVGYFGEKLAIFLQSIGLNSCWVALTFSKSKVKKLVSVDEKLVCVLATGYGETQGIAHKSKEFEKLCKANGDMPDWFKNGMESVMLAPTAMNQQKFFFELLKDGRVKAGAGRGFYTKVDLGIAKYHFEVGAGRKVEFVQE